MPPLALVAAAAGAGGVLFFAPGGEQMRSALHTKLEDLRVRMAACELLQRPGASGQLAAQFGYAANSRFTVDFASVFRITPSKLIRALTARLVAPAGVCAYTPKHVPS